MKLTATETCLLHKHDSLVPLLKTNAEISVAIFLGDRIASLAFYCGNSFLHLMTRLLLKYPTYSVPNICIPITFVYLYSAY